MEKLLNETQARLSIFRSIIKTVRETGVAIDNGIIHHALDAAFGIQDSDNSGDLFTNIFQNMSMPFEDCQCESDELPTGTPESYE